MPHSLRLLTAFFPLIIFACGPSESEAGETVSVDPSEVGAGPETDTTEDNRLALDPGLYVTDGSNCSDPANAGYRVWTGRGLEGSATKGCTLEITSRDGETYTGRQSCVNTYDDSRTDTDVTIEVLEPGSFVLTEADETTHLTLCPEGEAPEWVQEKLWGESK
ncbi:hypothetical protein [Lewinella sp. IMCC34183]|uniref:hypothetical protein n=1 Tax=Lewinella sp. IMCC34183 TaxID=2248762 RepID=UPI000E25A716|nr:hypothetical protein [Lewinella sp. IMCC34183]